MARPKAKPDLGDIFRKTEGARPAQAEPEEPEQRAPGEIPATGLTRAVGVGLKESEVAALDDLAEELGIARNSLIRFAVRYFLREYRAGRVQLEVIPPEQRNNRLRMP